MATLKFFGAHGTVEERAVGSAKKTAAAGSPARGSDRPVPRLDTSAKTLEREESFGSMESMTLDEGLRSGRVHAAAAAAPAPGPAPELPDTARSGAGWTSDAPESPRRSPRTGAKRSKMRWNFFSRRKDRVEKIDL